MKSVISKQINRGQNNNKSNNLKQQRTKRNRTAKVTAKRVIATGEQPSDRVTKNGKLRHLDLAAKGQGDHHIPRKTREFMARMNKWKSRSGGSAPLEGQEGQTSITNVAVPSLDVSQSKTKRDSRNHFSHQNGSGDGAEQSTTDPASEKREKGRKPGESVADCTARLKNESKQMAIDLARAGNHQREKRKAYHKKRRERLQRRKRRRRGEYSDSEVEDDDNYDDENAQRISHLPGYWQEIVRNNGRPLSAKKRRRLDRLETEAAAKRKFGDQVERPPDLTVLPVRRSKATGVRAG